MNILIWADDHPVFATCIVAALIFVGLRIWSLCDDDPVLLAAAKPQQRVELLGQIASSAVAILGISLTVLAILIALPDRPVISDLRKSDTWPRLRALLLTIALLALVAVVTSHIGAGVDNATHGLEWLEQVTLASAAAGVLALLVAGLTFSLVLKKAEGPDDPSRARGQGR